MRITLFYSVLFLTLFSDSYSDSYNQARENLKLEFYNSQQGLMDIEHYYEFIEPYIQKAEKILKVPVYCVKYADSETSKKYLACLRRYNVACFHECARSHSIVLMFASRLKKFSKERLEQSEANLLEAIMCIKEEAGIKDLDAQEELRKTIQLFQEANKKYYKKLGIKFKFWYPLALMI